MGNLFSSKKEETTRNSAYTYQQPSSTPSNSYYRPSSSGQGNANIYCSNYNHSPKIYKHPSLTTATTSSYGNYSSSQSGSYFCQPSSAGTSNNPYHREPTIQFSQSTFDYNLNKVIRTVDSLTISSRSIESPQRSKRNAFLFSNVILSGMQTYTELYENHPEYLQVKRMISNKRNFKVDSIEKIQNPYLQKAYELKKMQKELQYSNLEEVLLFHGTKKANVDTICRENFDWRLCKAHKYGQGVSFSPNSTYASNYSDKRVHNKIMIVAKVLIGRTCLGHENMLLPDEGCDTSQKGFDGVVIVKYDDHEFCPVYKINYHLINENVGKGRRY